jgi:hypothetical protein
MRTEKQIKKKENLQDAARGILENKNKKLKKKEKRKLIVDEV